MAHYCEGYERPPSPKRLEALLGVIELARFRAGAGRLLPAGPIEAL